MAVHWSLNGNLNNLNLLDVQRSLTVGEVQPDHGHDEALGTDELPAGEPEHQALQHLVGDGGARLPQQRPQVVRGGAGAVLLELLERQLRGRERRHRNGESK